jgi:pimeloyl-ACP methyl ester carboxylesterase
MEAITGARQMVIEGAYHSPQLTHPEAWLEAIRKHLSWVDGCSA